MNKRKIILASTGIAIAIAFISAIITLLPQEENHERSMQMGVLCETTWTLVYNDPTKYDESKIMNVLKENLSDDDFRDCVTASQPWTYVSISKPDENGTVKLTLPTASLNSSQKIMKIFSGMEGISLSNRTSGWITDSAHSNP